MSPELQLRAAPDRGVLPTSPPADTWTTQPASTSGRTWAQPVCRSPELQGTHQRRMQGVLSHIETHLAEDLSLTRLARLAAFSPFHFHRIFQAWTGETLKSFVRRRRLETSAARLVQHPQDKVVDIARACGFVSPESFSRAFREHFGRSPSQWRAGDRVLESNHVLHR